MTAFSVLLASGSRGTSARHMRTDDLSFAAAVRPTAQQHAVAAAAAAQQQIFLHR